jgi:signal transduction histidine kinase
MPFMRMLFNVLVLLLLVHTVSWAGNPTDTLVSITQLPPEGLLLDRGWKYRAGDDPAWAHPSFDDRGWQPIDPTRDIHDLPVLWKYPVGWFRLRFTLDSALHQESLALLVEQTGASEIYLNGRLLKKYGQFGNGTNGVRAAFPPFGEFISFPSRGGGEQVLAVRFALQKGIPYVNFAGRYNRGASLRVMEIESVTALTRSDTYFLDYIKASVFFILSLLHLVLFVYAPTRKANLYFFVFSLLSTTNYLLSGYGHQHVHMAAPRMFLLIFIFLLFTSSCFFFVLAAYSIFRRKRGLVFWLLSGAFVISLPLFLAFYHTGWLVGLMLFPMLTFSESARITLGADRKTNAGIQVVTYGAVAFLVLYPLALAFIFGILPAGPNGFFGHFAFNLGILSLPIALSIYLSAEASFTSRSLAARLVEVQELSEKTSLQEREKRQLQEMDQVKSRFFANISHEFRTPLALIRGTVETLMRKDEAGSKRQSRLPGHRPQRRPVAADDQPASRSFPARIGQAVPATRAGRAERATQGAGRIVCFPV